MLEEFKKLIYDHYPSNKPKPKKRTSVTFVSEATMISLKNQSIFTQPIDINDDDDGDLDKCNTPRRTIEFTNFRKELQQHMGHVPYKNKVHPSCERKPARASSLTMQSHEEVVNVLGNAMEQGGVNVLQTNGVAGSSNVVSDHKSFARSSSC